MAYTQADIDELDAEIKKVRLIQSTTIADQSTTFRPLDELLKLRSLMAQDISSVHRVRFAATSKGTIQTGLGGMRGRCR